MLPPQQSWALISRLCSKGELAQKIGQDLVGTLHQLKTPLDTCYSVGLDGGEDRDQDFPHVVGR